MTRRLAHHMSRRKALWWMAFGTGGFALAAQSTRAFSSDSAGGQRDPSLSTESAFRYLVELGIELSVFTELWRAAFPLAKEGGPGSSGASTLTASQRELEFQIGFAELVATAEPALQDELALVSRVMSSGWGRLALTGSWAALGEEGSVEVETRLRRMAACPWSFRRKAVTGILILLGMSHYSRRALESESGYPGVPPHVAALWTFPSESEPGAETPVTPRSPALPREERL